MKIVWGRSIGWNMSFNGMGNFKPPGWTSIQITQRIFDGPDCYDWREVFALLPVKTISGKYAWLRKIYKRRFWVLWGQHFHMEPYVEYAELFEILES
jgi:hypothetical protein